MGNKLTMMERERVGEKNFCSLLTVSCGSITKLINAEPSTKEKLLMNTSTTAEFLIAFDYFHYTVKMGFA